MSGVMPTPLLLPGAANHHRRPGDKVPKRPSNFALETLATARVGLRQYRIATLFCATFAVATIFLLPFAADVLPPVPGFFLISQTALIIVYGITTCLIFAQYRSTRSVPVLILGSGSLYTTLAVLAQLICLPNTFVPGLIAGTGSATLAWIWNIWHLGPPLFALPFAIMEGRGQITTTQPRFVSFTMWSTVVVVCAISGLSLMAAIRYVSFLPIVIDGDSYQALNTSGIGPMLVGLTVLALGVLCWLTRLRTVLQLWLAVSLFLLILDNVSTDVGAARSTIGWFLGRGEALLAALVVLGIYLREISRLWDQARAQTRIAQQNLEIALDASGMGDFDLDLATDTSRRTLRHDQFFGYSAIQPAWGWARTMEHIVPEDRAVAATALDVALNGGWLEFECRIRRAGDGVMRWIAMFGRTSFDDAGQPKTLSGCLMDVTERKHTEARLREAERMEAVGQLTGGLAHDFNNLLTVILGNLEMIARRPGDPARVERLATSAFAAGRRGAEMTDRLLTFSRRQMLSPKTVNLNELLTELLPLIRHAVGEAVSVELEFDKQLDLGFVDQSQLQAAVLNLAGNARDAMPNGGKLRIRTRNIVIKPLDALSMSDGKPGTFLHVSVSDTGTGMDAASAARAFEPFFTTKDVGKGTGLGLSQVYGFVSQTGGFCNLTSLPGHGCTVDLYLPRSLDPASASFKETFVVPLQQAENGEVVLIVEDERAVREMAAENLVGLGYSVLCAPDARVALDFLRGPNRIDILFSDVVMPGGMNGAQLAIEARAIRPGLRVVLTSGYTSMAAGGARELPEGVQLLRKPYLSEDLSMKLRM